MTTARLLLLPCLASSSILLAAPPPESYPCQNGLVRSLVAREPMFINPVAVAVDTDGAIYVTETARRKVADLDIREVMDWVPEDLSHTTVEQKRDFFHKAITDEKFKKHPSLKDHNKDGRIDWQDLTVHSEKIHKLVDTDGDGMADRATVFAEGFNTEVTGIAAGVLARHGDVYATIAPDVWKLRDTDGDGKADERKAIATGFGVHINYAGHDMHGLTMGPDGKVYWTIGDKGTNVQTKGRHWFYPHEGALLRCNPDGSDFEVFARGLRNVQQIAFDDYGNIFGVDNDSDQKGEKERLLYIVEGSDSGWRCYYQYRSGKYNPWMDERIAFPDGPDRPASILPPLSLYLDGPSGFAYNPGTALSERYRGHFFLTQFPAGKINAFKLEPDGAAYKMTGDHLMASGAAFTGCNFGPDGALYVADWQGGYPLKEKGAVWKIDDPKEARSTIREEVLAILREGAEKAPVRVLTARLGHADQRVRLDAQWELAQRKNWDALELVAASPQAPKLARIHALWGLSQGKRFVPALFNALTKESDPELRAQAAKWAGSCEQRTSELVVLLRDPSARVRFHAALAMEKSGLSDDPSAIIAMLEENGGRDPFLSHAGSFALRPFARRGNSAEMIARHPSPAVRMAMVVALRNVLQELNPVASEPPSENLKTWHREIVERLLPFLADKDPAVSAEAARALHEDTTNDFAVPELAGILDQPQGAKATTIRRAIAINRRIGDEACLLRLAKLAADTGAAKPLRLAALEALASVRSSEPLDAVDGHYAPLKPLSIDATLASRLSGLLAPLTEDAALSKAAQSAGDALGAKQDPIHLLKQALDPKLDSSLRLAALQHLSESGSTEWSDRALALLQDPSPALRSGAADLLAKARPDETLVYLRDRGVKSSDLAERQAAVGLLPTVRNSKPVLDALLADLAAGRLDPAIQLEAIEGARSLQLDSLHEAEAALAAKGSQGKWSYALAGGDAAAGKKVFEENLTANCMACHRIGAEGSNVGPPLQGIGAKGKEHLLQALVDPQASIAPGYGMMTLTKKDGSSLAGALVGETDGALTLQLPDGSKATVPLADIATKTPPISAMPPMGEILKPRELRDLLEYLSVLK